MIKKLRFRFLLAAMTALFLVLFVIIGALNVANYHNIVADSDETLSLLAENNGEFPIFSKHADSRDDNRMENRMRSAELPYESRYFSVLFASDGEILSTNTGRIAAIGSDTAEEYAKDVFSKNKEKGFIEDYRFLRSCEEDECTRIIFLDCGRQLSGFRSVLLVSIGSSLTGYLAVFILVFFLSGRIVRPISESYEKQRRFITDAGHEIKTPLTIIDADATVLELELGENEWLSDIRAQTRRLTSLTNDLIFLSRMEEAESHLQMIEFPLSDIATEAAESFHTLAKSQKKTFSEHISPMLSMSGDPKSIKQLLSVLLDNAMKYSDEGGFVILTAQPAAKGIEISVENSCEEVDRTKLPHLFDRFYRADESHNSQTGGHGIGLSIAQAIVAAHNGKISATTKDGKSLKITAIFPQR